MTDAEICSLIIKSIDNASAIWANHLNAAMTVIEAQAADNASIRTRLGRLEALEQRSHFERPNGGR